MWISQQCGGAHLSGADPLAGPAGWNCFCQIDQTLGEDLTACQEQTSSTPVNASDDAVHGFCYVDATTVPPTGNSGFGV